ncbi:efflux RND transporter periplasmic adaptor subunit [Ruegeria marisrubri]|uniref:efflux RND transporter periplasmic adaptor subunit n=1 Tax=Ruegeria marisrubri TaxID=1685379 RepID=UPI0012FD973F|nr:efflux RND transporter periplasmic adaptor subunit [Ruegeria marisrubri]
MRIVVFLFLTLVAPPLRAQDAPVFSGRIEALNKAAVSNAIASTVIGIHFEPGQRVREGDLLFTLDATDFELALATERANVLRAEATLTSARSDYERLKHLESRGSATGVQLLKAEVAQAFADAVRAETQAKLRAAELNMERTRIHAPISGVIGAPMVSVGEYVKKGRDPLAEIVQLDPIGLSYEIPYVQRLDELNLEDMRFPESLLESVELQLRISEDWVYPLPARPTNVSAEVDAETGTLTVRARVDNPNELLRPGMRITVHPRLRSP